MTTTSTLPGSRAVLAGLLTLTVSTGVSLAQNSLVFEPFKAADIIDPMLNDITIEGIIIETPDGIKIGIFNNSVSGDGWVTANRPTVARVYIDGEAAVFGDSPYVDSVLSSPEAVFVVGGSPPDLPGGNEIGFSADFVFTATKPQPLRGIDPGEVAFFHFTGANHASVIQGLTDGSARIGIHILEVGPKGEDSVAFVNRLIPEPSAALLGLLSATLLLRRRR